MSQVKAKREAAGLSMSEVARRAKMLGTKLWKIEHGERRLTLEDAARLAEVLGCDVKDFLPQREHEPGSAS